MYELLKNLSLVVTVIHILIMFLFGFRYRYSKKNTMIVAGCISIPLIILNTYLIFNIDTVDYVKFMLFSLVVPSFLLFLFLSDDKGSRFIFTYFFLYTFVYWVMLLTGLFENLIGADGWILFLSRFIALPVIEYVIFKYIRKPYTFILKNIKSGWLMLSVVTIFFYLILIIASVYPTIIYERPDDCLLYLLLLLIIPIMYWALFLLLNSQINNFKTQELNNLLVHQQNELELQLENQNEIRKINHNLKAYINTLSILINNEEYDKAKKEIDKISKLNNYNYQLCPNSYINIILTNYKKKFDKHNIEFNVDAFHCPPELKHTTEFILMLSLALDNSYECLTKLRTKAKNVSIKMKQNGSYLLIRIKNTCDKSLSIEEGIIPESTKDEKGHGIGVSTIVETANKLGGDAVCYAKDGVFTLDIVVKAK